MGYKLSWFYYTLYYGHVFFFQHLKTCQHKYNFCLNYLKHIQRTFIKLSITFARRETRTLKRQFSTASETATFTNPAGRQVRHPGIKAANINPFSQIGQNKYKNIQTW
jgi:hypothetical protein